MKHIVSFSGGKDSTAMLLLMLEKGMPVDEIVFCDTGKEFPQMYNHIAKVEEYIDRKITVIKPPKSFDYWMFEHVKTKGKNKGKRGYGWPLLKNCRWCTSRLKLDPFLRYIKHYDGVVEYHGIAFDETHRVKSIAGRDIRYPLIEWGMTEQDCLEYCYERGFNWSGLYKHFKRVSCWCCPFQSLADLKSLYKYYPYLWQELKRMDELAYNRFRADYTLEELEQRFENEAVL